MPSLRRPGRVKTVLFLASVDSLPSREPPLSPSFHPQSVRSTPLSLTDRDAVLFAPSDGHPPEFELLELIPGVPQGVFVQQAFE
jgi:hypothetical protein